MNMKFSQLNSTVKFKACDDWRKLHPRSVRKSVKPQFQGKSQCWLCDWISKSSRYALYWELSCLSDLVLMPSPYLGRRWESWQTDRLMQDNLQWQWNWLLYELLNALQLWSHWFCLWARPARGLKLCFCKAVPELLPLIYSETYVVSRQDVGALETNFVLYLIWNFVTCKEP
jgi:hypothetical protein